ncbi:MAG: diguanylate cyclase domain-containing protein [Aulosira sp. ZfuVER01]|nr:diguanylate cyclase [Aulosira sp. ZfuVER01]MDZ7998640.1 diguanylate cyclase [Aulosira sp. DedVER01a]MDZ8054812.1 diguanylate cyclase [Aulosira sp. ZfuCHP01]
MELKFYQAEQKYRQIVEQIPGNFYILPINSNAEAAYISPQLKQLLGISVEDWQPSALYSWSDYVHPCDRDRVWQAVKTTISTGEPLSVEYRMITHHGRTIWVRDQANLVLYVDGQTQVLEGLLLDISNYKEVEEILRQSEERYRAIVEDQTELITRILPDGSISFVNEAFCRFFGLKREEIIAQQYEPVVFEEDRQRVVSLINSINLENPVVKIENRVIACGQVRWTQWNNRGIFDDRGNIVEIQSVGRDITDVYDELHLRKQVEEALRSSQEFLEKVANTVPQILYLFDLLQGTSTYLNQRTETILGYSVEEICGADPQWLLNCFHPNDQHLCYDVPSRFTKLSDNEVLSTEYQFRHKNGQWRWLNTREVIFARDANGTPTQILGSVEDITTRKTAEALLQQQAQRERLITELTQQIRQSLNLDEVLNTTVNSIRQCLRSDSVAIYQIQSDGGGNFVAESLGDRYPKILEQTLHPFLLKKYFSHYVQGLPIVVHDIQHFSFSADDVDFLQRYQIKAAIVVPILNGNDLWGLLIAHQYAAPRHWQTFEVNLLQELANQVAIAIHQSILYQQTQVANEKLQRLATLDGLTQIANRRRFDEYLEVQWKQHQREQLPLSLILFDVDCFKTYNDTYGHLAGDDCLRQLANALKRVVQRPTDLVARYGGEEFTVILPLTEVQGAIHVAQAIRQAVHNLAIPHAQSSVCNCVTISLGIVSIVPNPKFSPSDLINAADKALYTAKQQGRDRLVSFAV